MAVMVIALCLGERIFVLLDFLEAVLIDSPDYGSACLFIP